MAKTYNELNDLVEKQEKIILSQQRTIDTLVNSLNSKEDKITEINKLESDLVDDTNQTNKFVTEQNKTDWNGKSVVVPNPTLEGTETALEGLEVNGIKYKTGGGSKLYLHSIIWTNARGGCPLSFSIITNDATPYTSEIILKEAIKTAGFTTSSNFLIVACYAFEYYNDTSDNSKTVYDFYYNKMYVDSSDYLALRGISRAIKFNSSGGIDNHSVNYNATHTLIPSVSQVRFTDVVSSVPLN